MSHIFGQIKIYIPKCTNTNISLVSTFCGPSRMIGPNNPTAHTLYVPTQWQPRRPGTIFTKSPIDALLSSQLQKSFISKSSFVKVLFGAVRIVISKLS